MGDINEAAPAFWKKMHAVMGDVGRIKKTGHNEAQNYDYITEDAVAEIIRESMLAKGLAFACECHSAETAIELTTRNGTDMPVTRADLVFTIADIETGYEKRFPFVGDGMDTGDKGLYKAITGGDKYFLLKTFLLPTGDDPENNTEEPGDRPRTAEPPKTDTVPEGMEASLQITFGKHQGKTLGQILETDKGYVEWLSKNARDDAVKAAAGKLLPTEEPEIPF